MEFFNDIGSDPFKPSLFELIAQEQLRDLLQPALKYVLVVFAQQYPRYLLRIVNRHEEFYALIMLIVERHYLRKHNASFAENFYGLKRIRRPFIPTNKTNAAVGGIGGKLRNREIWRSLLFLIGVPYLRAKAQDYYEELGGGISPEMMDERQLGRGRIFKAIYPWVNMGFEGWLLVWNVGYLFEKKSCYRPWLSWMGVELRRAGVEEEVVQRRGGAGRVLDSLRVLLPTAIFFVKFLEWWYSPNSPARALSASPVGPAIPPPRILLPHGEGVGVDAKRYGECPICKKQVRNATALPSGYVYCYRCVQRAVSRTGRCPVTFMPVFEWQLRRVLV